MAAILGGADVLSTVLDLAGEQDYVAGLLTAAGGHRAFDRAVDSSNRRLALFGMASGVVAAGLATGLVKAAQEAGRLEQIQIGFGTILKSADAAKSKIAELQQFAKETPFNFLETATLAKQLIAMGTTASEVVPVMRDLGDTVAALGGGNDVLQRVVFNFGQIQTTGKLTMRELRDFAIAGIPVFDILREKLGLTQEELMRVGEQGISADRGLKALREGLRERFGGAMEAQNKTLFGSFSMLQDSLQQAAAGIGKVQLGPLTSGFRLASQAIDVFNGASDGVKSAVGIIGVGLAGAAGLAAVGLLRATLATGKLAAENVRLTNAALTGKGGADGQRTAEDLLAGALGRAGRATMLLTGWTQGLEAAHWAAARGANAQAAAVAGIGRGAGAGSSGAGMAGAGAAGIGVGAAAAAGPRYVRNAAGRWMDANTGRLASAADVRADALARGEVQGQYNARVLAAEHARRAGTGAMGTTFMPGTAGAAAKAAGAEAGTAAAGRVAGMLGTAAGFMKGKGTVAAIVAEVAGHLALSQLPDEGAAGGFKRISQGALTGAGIGGTIGSFIAPGVGTAIGAAGGALVGGGLAAVGEQKAGAAETDQKKILAELQKANEINTKLLEAVDRQGKFPVSTDFVPGSLQVPILRALGKAL